MDTDVVLELRRITGASNPYKAVLGAALSLSLKTGALRSLHWKVLLGLLPAPTHASDELLDGWIDAALAQRKELASRNARGNGADPPRETKAVPDAQKKTKKVRRFGDSSSSDSDEGEELVSAAAAADDPLSTAQNSKYVLEFQRKKAIDGVDKDVARLWCDDPFFEDDDVKDQIREILIAHCIDGPGAALGYRQGMHEVLSLVYFVLARDAEAVEGLTASTGRTPASSPSPSPSPSATSDEMDALRAVCSRAAVPQDARLLFERIVGPGPDTLNLASWYGVVTSAAAAAAASPTLSPSTSTPASPVAAVGAGVGGGAVGPLGQVCHDDADDEHSPVVAVAHRIHHVRLRAVNPPLFAHLSQHLNIPPQTYLLRWLRLLFLREFSFAQCALIWDVVFAEMRFATHGESNARAADGSGEGAAAAPGYSIDDSILIDVAVQMLQFVSAELLQADYANAVRRLMRYPPVEDTAPFLRRALVARYSAGSPLLRAAGIDRGADRGPAALPGVEEGSGRVAGSPPPPPLTPLAEGRAAATPSATPTAAAPAAAAAAIPLAASAAAIGGRASPGGGGRARPLPGTESAEELRDKQLRMGLVLASVIGRLEGKWFAPDSDGAAPRSAEEAERRETDYLLAIAELKKVRDVLLNNVCE